MNTAYSELQTENRRIREDSKRKQQESQQAYQCLEEQLGSVTTDLETTRHQSQKKVCILEEKIQGLVSEKSSLAIKNESITGDLEQAQRRIGKLRQKESDIMKQGGSLLMQDHDKLCERDREIECLRRKIEKKDGQMESMKEKWDREKEDLMEKITEESRKCEDLFKGKEVLEKQRQRAYADLTIYKRAVDDVLSESPEASIRDLIRDIEGLYCRLSARSTSK